MNLPRIAITMGDPAGVGPEICLKLLADQEIAKICHPIVFGDAQVLANVAAACDLPVCSHIIDDDGPSNWQTIQQPTVFHLVDFAIEDLSPGVVSAQTGTSSFAYINAAIDAALGKHVDAVVTGPIHKEAWKQAGIDYPGHTELFADRAGSNRFCMMMTAPSFSCSLVTTHVGYHEVPGTLTTELILEVIELTHQALQKICKQQPSLIALGLNPHAGENGLFGNHEEEQIIAPAIEQAQSNGINIVGPVPPDTAFLPWKREQTDGYICMYHDQGLIPFKALNFETGVNITLGLPLIRTSVDHGTALDIAWQGQADVSSLIAAVQLATQLATGDSGTKTSHG